MTNGMALVQLHKKVNGFGPVNLLWANVQVKKTDSRPWKDFNISPLILGVQLKIGIWRADIMITIL